MTKKVRIYAIGTLWLFSNIIYALLRAQGKKDTEYLRIVSFLCGLPHSLLTYLCVDFGRKTAYGIDVPTNEDVRNAKCECKYVNKDNKDSKTTNSTIVSGFVC